jgi:hypothetical protein
LESRKPLAVVEGFTFAEQRENEVSKRGEIAGGADGTLARNAWPDFSIVQVDQSFDYFATDATISSSERGDFQNQDKSNGVGVEELADTNGMRTDKIELEL